ncbi:hypothetical protein GH714_030148 [Hevea brasiliensis]|uniref:Hexosyltransferase n=1 Tax=Hevea brasiliensis TaxID=3981 RepID=A0A6A6LHF1_HEVBR|nr:hypothetical protein GH714_030148 [Hevea brasiliensis]
MGDQNAAPAARPAAAAQKRLRNDDVHGTPRDYEFYVAIRVMIRSFARLNVDADLVVIASVDVPLRWVHTLEQDDGAKVVRVDNVNNPYKNQANFDRRFKLTLNKLYAWSLVDYERVVMLDADNLFLQKLMSCSNVDNFVQSSSTPASSILVSSCYRRLLLQPSMVVFKDMLHQLDVGQDNPDVQTRALLVATSQTCLTSRCFILPEWH